MVDHDVTQLINEKSSHEVHLFEKEDWLGGHAHTVTVQSESGQFSLGAQLTPRVWSIGPGKEACEIDTYVSTGIST